MLCSEDTRHEAPNFVYRQIDRVRVKGKLLPVDIYEVVGRDGEVPGPTVAGVRQFEQALKLYRAQQWADAKRMLEKLKEADPDHLLYDIYRERIEAFEENPPPEDWDGVFVHQSK
jgi:adenylate cyclase